MITSKNIRRQYRISSNLVFVDFSEGFPYYSRPGIVLDDPEFKPHIGGQRRPIQVQVPSKGDVFDIMVSAIQGPADKPELLTRKRININMLYYYTLRFLDNMFQYFKYQFYLTETK